MIEEFEDLGFTSEITDQIEAKYQQLNDIDKRKKEEVLKLKKEINALIDDLNKVAAKYNIYEKFKL